jgi:glycosyltransferase involved in cell wall biosynthesis
MALGKPIIATSVGAEGLDVLHEREMLLADTPTGFAREIGRVLDDPSLAGKLGKAARHTAESRYSWRAAARALEGFYRETMNRPARA